MPAAESAVGGGVVGKGLRERKGEAETHGVYIGHWWEPGLSWGWEETRAEVKRCAMGMVLGALA